MLRESDDGDGSDRGLLAPFEWVIDHGDVGDRKEGLWNIFGFGEWVETGSWTAKDDGLEAE